MFISKNLEVHVVDHCNLDCTGCSHGSPFMKARLEDPERLSRSLLVLWGFYQAPLIKLLGGEPLLHPRISEIISTIKTVTGSRVRLVTNGTLLEQRYDHLGGIDEIHISVYQEAKVPSEERLRAIAQYLRCAVTIQSFNYFRWEKSQPRDDNRLTERVFSTCQLFHSWQCHTLRDGWFYACPPAATWSQATGEGVYLLDGDCSIREKMDHLLLRSAPFVSCRECLGSAGQRFEHHLGWRKTHNKLSTGDVDYKFLHELESDPMRYNGCFRYDRTYLPSGEIVKLATTGG